MSKALLLSLGHNSSAVLVDGDTILCGFENERLTGKKSDSGFPIESIYAIKKFYEIPNDVAVFISHWFTLPDIHNLENKWFSYSLLKSLFPDCTIHSLSDNFSHHDAHAYSALLFAGPSFATESNHILVIDGFGTYGEVLSLYKCQNNSISHIDRSYGFNNSLGLMYQYATSYLGMKMHQDEYKMLGYESSVSKIHGSVATMTNLIVARLFDRVSKKYDPSVNIGALPETMAYWYQIFDQVTEKSGIIKGSKPHKVLIATFVQQVLESVVLAIIKTYGIKRLAVAGGIFMNVKLNNAISRVVDKLHIMPLCGDAGATLGLYYSKCDLKWPGHLFWGKRDLTSFFDGSISADRLHVLNKSDAISYVVGELDANRIINIVHGSMEYGPRALGHTSTVALPIADNVIHINSCNDRATIMPMAGFCRDIDLPRYHDPNSVDKLGESMKYMICTADVQEIRPDILGATHLDVNRRIYTGRTQVVEEADDSIFYSILRRSNSKLLINTSFNPHGVPIPYNAAQILSAHLYMTKNDKGHRVSTVIIKE